MSTFWVLVPIVAMVLSAGLTFIVRRFALRKELMDVPNARSSHSVPTPSMGGLAIVVVVLVGFWLAGTQAAVPVNQILLLSATSAVIALVGLYDDWRGVAAGWRLLAQAVCAGALVLGIGGAPSIAIGHWTIESSAVLDVLAILFIVWLTNLYNFMDGIDGLAAVEGVTVALSAAMILWVTGGTAFIGLYLLVAGAIAGFAVWNWAPARIFMGDTGSAFLGFLFGGFAVLGEANGGLSVWVWVILLSVFIADATFTLCRRLATGQRAHEAHRSHAYQRLSRRLGSHQAVSMGVLSVNAFVLFPLGWWVQAGGIDGALIATAVVGGLSIVAAIAGAGRPDVQT